MVLAWASAAVHAQSTRVRAIGWDLSETSGTLELLDQDRVSILLKDGSKATLEPDNLALIEFTSTLEKSYSTGDIGDVTNGLLRLVDGTRYTGWSEVEDGQFVWRNWWAGTVRPSVDDILSFIERGRDEPLRAGDEDVLVLRNGDRVDGLIAAIGENVEIERPDGTNITVPLDRVESVALVNTPRPRTGTRAWLTPGDEVKIESYRFDPGTGLRVPNHEALMANYVSAIAFDVGSITPLVGVTARVSELPDAPRYRVPEPKRSPGAWPLDTPPIELRGPMRVQWVLPEAGMGFVARARIPRSARRFGDLELVVFDGGTRRSSVTLNRDAPLAEIAVALKTNQLAIEIHEAGTGPIQDVVQLERALLIKPR